MENITNSFPNKSEDELKTLQKKILRYFCDMLFETLKTLTISKANMIEHCKFSNETYKLFNDYAAKKQNVIIVMGHYANWEWAGNTFGISCKQQLYVIYHPLSNKNFEKLIVRMRSRFGTKLIAMKDTFRFTLNNKKELSATAFIADQTPPANNAYWTKFLNQDTPIFKGTEKIAQKLNYPIVYASLRKIKRGYYEIDAEVLHENPSQAQENEITELHTRRLEKDILACPELWLWSHRRWKHKMTVA